MALMSYFSQLSLTYDLGSSALLVKPGLAKVFYTMDFGAILSFALTDCKLLRTLTGSPKVRMSPDHMLTTKYTEKTCFRTRFLSHCSPPGAKLVKRARSRVQINLPELDQVLEQA